MVGQMVGPEFGKVTEVCRRLNVSRTALYGVMNRGELGYTKIGKVRRIRWSEVEKYLERQTVQGR